MENVDVKEFLFVKRLNELAERSGQELTKQEIEAYDRAVSPFGYEAAVPVLDELLLNQQSGRPLPSITHLIDLLMKQNLLTDKALALKAVDRLMSRVSLRGYTWPTQFENKDDFKKAFLLECGDLCWEMVHRLGGWVLFCEIANNSYKNRETFLAQLRDLGLGVIDQSRLGILDEPPSLPKPKAKHLELISNLSNQVSMERKSGKQLPEGKGR